MNDEADSIDIVGDGGKEQKRDEIVFEKKKVKEKKSSTNGE